MPSEKVGIDIYARVKPVKRRYARSHMARVHLDCIFLFSGRSPLLFLLSLLTPFTRSLLGLNAIAL